MPKFPRKLADSPSNRSKPPVQSHAVMSSSDQVKERLPAFTSREARYGVLSMMAAKKWEALKNILTNRDHEWHLLLDGDEDVLFRELSLAVTHVTLGETKLAKRCLERILRISPEEGRAQLLYAYLNLTENNSEQAVIRYTMLLDRKEFQFLVKNVLTAVKNTNSLYKLTLNKPLKFFYVHYRRTWNDALYTLPRQCLRKLSAPWRWLWGLGFLTLFCVIILSMGVFSERSSNMPLHNTLASWRLWLTHQAYFLGLRETTEELQNFEALTLEDLTVQEATSAATTDLSHYQAYFKQMKQAISTSAINEALVTYNDVMLTQPSIPVAERFDILKAFIPAPDLNSFENSLLLTNLLAEPARYKATYWKWRGEISALRKLDIASEPAASPLTPLPSEVDKHNNIVFSFAIREAEGVREIVEVFFDAETIFPREGERYEILMSFIGLSQRYRPYMQGMAMERLP